MSTFTGCQGGYFYLKWFFVVTVWPRPLFCRHWLDNMAIISDALWSSVTVWSGSFRKQSQLPESALPWKLEIFYAEAWYNLMISKLALCDLWPLDHCTLGRILFVTQRNQSFSNAPLDVLIRNGHIFDMMRKPLPAFTIMVCFQIICVWTA